MTKFQITIMRPEDDQFQGLKPLADIIENGLACVTTGCTRVEQDNAIDLIFYADPKSIEDDLWLQEQSE